ncbi:MAG: HAMP domain-containing sensor histidine kinase [Planctomycetota bacterium]
MRRSWHIWIAFGLCLAVVLVAMGWISLKALGLEGAEIEARRQAARARQEAALEQDVQWALYRMEFALMPLVTQESARPYFVYDTFLPVDASQGRTPDAQPGPSVAISPLVREGAPDILLHFQFEPDGRLTSPRVPDPAKRFLVVPGHISRAAVEEAESRLARLAAAVDRNRLLARLPDAGSEPSPLAANMAQIPQQSLLNEQFQADVRQQGRGLAEFNRRSQVVKQSANVANTSGMFLDQAAGRLADAAGAVMTPLWIEEHLILARRIRRGGQEYVQGCLVDWPSIKRGLLMAVEDLLPEADLEPVAATADEDEARRLAALPVRLVPGRRPPGPTEPSGPETSAAGRWSPIRISLLVAWACVLLAALAVAALTAGVIRLSERRAAFVSAVTHELRTPLTTFHMYTEMLAEGMVPDPEQRQEYLGTLRSEASRLSHLVENVLSYARLERGRADGRVEDVVLGELLKPIEARLADRARHDGMEIVVEGDEAAFSTIVRANPSAVEQILLNLIDNAGKYAGEASDKRIHLGVRLSDAAAELRVRDHGPGISRPVARRLFRSFGKSAREAAHSAPGVGLGLALSRRLAHDMGARLRLDRSVTDGACFVLSLAVSSGAPE